MRKLKRTKINDKGTTYLSLLIGITILLVGIGFFMKIFSSSRISMFLAEEQMAMATVAQNMAQVYTATGDEETAESQGILQGYPDVNLEVNSGPTEGMETIVITVPSKTQITATSDHRYIEDYRLVFYTPVQALEEE